MRTAVLEPAAALDEAAVLALNNAHAVETSLLDAAGLRAMLAQAFYARGIARGEQAFLIAFEQHAAYESRNFLWFQERYARFVYIDRVVTSPAARGQGHARALYADLFARALSAGHDIVACEVNLEPPNPGSEAFHERLGFEEVGRGAAGAKVVRYFARRLAPSR